MSYSFSLSNKVPAIRAKDDQMRIIGVLFLDRINAGRELLLSILLNILLAQDYKFLPINDSMSRDVESL